MLFQILLLSAALETGFVSGGTFNYSANDEKWLDIGALYASLSVQATYKAFYIGGQMDSYFTPTSIVNYNPFQMTFVFRAGFDFGNVRLGYEHSCFHPMQAYATIIGNEIKPKYEGGYNKFFIRIISK
jgi:hypothetical protein